jgi:hypothetical protein
MDGVWNGVVIASTKGSAVMLSLSMLRLMLSAVLVSTLEDSCLSAIVSCLTVSVFCLTF